MLITQRVELEWGGRKLVLESGKWPDRPTAQSSHLRRDDRARARRLYEGAEAGQDFFPQPELPGGYYAPPHSRGFFKREGRPTEERRR